MKVQSRQKDGKVFVNLVLTVEEVYQILDDKVLSDESPALSVQVAVCGEE